MGRRGRAIGKGTQLQTQPQMEQEHTTGPLTLEGGAEGCCHRPPRRRPDSKQGPCSWRLDEILQGWAQGRASPSRPARQQGRAGGQERASRPACFRPKAGADFPAVRSHRTPGNTG